MKYTRIFTLSSALIVAATVFGASAEARKSDLDQCTASGLNKAECACAMALEKGTKKALRDYLKLYRNADTACSARASTANAENSTDSQTDGSTEGETETEVADVKDNNGLGNGDEGDCQGGGCSDGDNPGHSNDSDGNDSGGGDSHGNKH